MTASLSDAVATVDSTAGDHTYFGTPVIGPNGSGYAWDTASRFPNGVDTDSAGDWATQDNYALYIEYGDGNDALGTAGGSNVPEPATLALLLAGGLFASRRRR